MKSRNAITILTAFFTAPMLAFAGVAETSATAGSNGRGPGTAAATAAYDGNGIGITRTKARSGRLNVARGISVGLDADGLTISNSFALAGRVGPAVGGTFNLHIGTDGQAAFSTGTAKAGGDRSRSVTVGGAAGEVNGRPVATAQAGGSTGRRGWVKADTRAETTRSHSRLNERVGRISVRSRR